MYTILLVIHTLLVLFLIGSILLQRADSDGMGGLGGGGGNQFMTGRAQANLLTRTTAILATLFIISSLTLAIMSGKRADHSLIDRIATGQQEAPTSPTPESKDAQKPTKATTPSVPKPE